MSSFNNPFGGGSNTPKPSPFGGGNTSAGATPTLFGAPKTDANSAASTSASAGLFGGGSNGGPGLFSGASSATPASTGGGLFGGGQATPGASQPGFSFGVTKPAGEVSGGANSTKPLFGAIDNTPKFNFGGASAGKSPPTVAPPRPGHTHLSHQLTTHPAATPSTTKTFVLNSTTPAGPPPGPTLFGGQASQPPSSAASQQQQQQPGSNPFGQKAPGSSAPPTSGLFGGAQGTSAGQGQRLGGPTFGFGNKDAPADASKNTPSQPAAAKFGFGSANPSGTPGTQDAQAKPQGSLFSGGSTTPAPTNKPSGLSFGITASSAQQASSQPSTTPASAPSFGFGTAKPAAPSTGPSGSSGAPTFGIAAPKPGSSTPLQLSAASGATSTAASSGAAPTAPSGSSLFSGLGGQSSTPATSAPASTTPMSSMFSGLSKPTTAAPTSATATTAAPPASLFPGLGANKPATTTAPASSTAQTAPASGASAPAASTATADASKTTTTGMASSTAGPAPSSQSRLKNKSMDEIITRWAADLSKYQKEFQQQAEQVASWDRTLVENSDKVKQLYSKTFQAERDAAEVERQLRIMEENQDELEAYLDRYEKEVEGLMKTHGVSGQGRSDGLRGPDQERERTYKLAEKLQDRLNELNKDLTEMIEEINTTSQTLSKTGKPDDPLTKVVRVLNSQLAQLQQIETGTAQLQDKIKAAQKDSARVGANGWQGLGSNATEDFLRSYRGGRSERFGGV
ncbi:hypothetical protein P154DRAFT_517665, partial [Amniculicola lignicola CBS 123094]